MTADLHLDDTEAAAFDAFARRIGPPLRRALVAHFGVEIGEEATAEAMRVAWERWPGVGEMANPSGYLYRVGQSHARPHVRWRRRKAAFPVRDRAARADVDRHELGPVFDALAALRPEERTAIVLVRSYGYTYAEVAELLDVSEAAVTNHLHRGLERLRRNLGVTT